MEKMKHFVTNRIFLLVLVVVLFIIVFAGFTSWYLIAERDIVSETNLVHKTQTTEATGTSSIDQDISSIDKEVNSTSDEDFSDNQLNDTQVGL